MVDIRCRPWPARLAAVALLLAGPGPSASAQTGTAFVGATVITMDAAGVLPDHTVLIRGDTIVAIGPSRSLAVPQGYRRIDAGGRWLIPGLIDLHVHLATEADLAANLRHGVTTVLQMSGRRGDSLDFLSLRNRIEAGTVAGPRLVLTGPLFDILGLPRETTAHAIASLEQVPGIVARHRAAGYDFFKVHNRVPAAVYRQLVGGGLPVIGHLPMGVPLEEVLRGQAMIAHAELFYYALFGYRSIVDSTCTEGFWPCVARARADPSVLGDLTAQVRASGIAVTANLAYLAAEEQVYRDFGALLADPEFTRLPPGVQESWRRDRPENRSFMTERKQDLANRTEFVRELVARFAGAGVPILAGTDAPLPGLFPGRALHLELEELARAGLTPEAALRAATASAGAFLAAQVPRLRPVGQIRLGGVADLVLLGADPLANVAATADIVGVMAHGVWRPAVAAAAPDRP